MAVKECCPQKTFKQEALAHKLLQEDHKSHLAAAQEVAADLEGSLARQNGVNKDLEVRLRARSIVLSHHI